jgi:hypothetical protein
MTPGFQSYLEFDDPLDERQPADILRGGLGTMCEDPDRFCETHRDLASPAALKRKAQMERRLAFIYDLWNDPDRFDVVVTSGRYLKLCNLLDWISEHDERAEARVKNEILAARRQSAA